MVFLCPLSRAKADPSYTYFYWSNITATVRMDRNTGNDPLLNCDVGVDYGMGFVSSNFTYDFTSQPAIGGDSWDITMIGNVSYAHDTRWPWAWYVESGYISAISTEGYAACYPPDTDFTYYVGIVYDPVEGIWYDNTLTDPDSGLWMPSGEAPGGFDASVLATGGDNWEFHEVNSLNYAYDPIIDQWYSDDGYNEEYGVNTFSKCADPN